MLQGRCKPLTARVSGLGLRELVPNLVVLMADMLIADI